MRTKRKTKARSIIMFISILLVLGLFSYLGVYGTGDIGGYKVQPFGEVIERGLDLQGGISILQEVSSEGKVDEETIANTIDVLNLRVNSMGVGETTIVAEGENRIRIEIPGVFDLNSVNKSLTTTGKLEFVGPDNVVILTGSDVKNATAVIDEYSQPQVSLVLNESGKTKFAVATEKFLGQPISIKMDDEIKSSPTVQAIISNGEASITGSGTLEESKQLAATIRSGALPVTLKNVETNTVGPTLGETAVPLSLKAGFIGIMLVFLFMIVYYRVPGLLADLALVLYIILLLFAFKTFGVVLTLPGIAGFLLTIGMAVDANVLIFERIKEELNTGKSIRSSVDAGFHRALSSIVDSNITTIIAGVVLYYLGSGAVKGFALTLIIGILMSMFSAIVVTKYLMKVALNAGILNKISYFGVKRG